MPDTDMWMATRASKRGREADAGDDDERPARKKLVQKGIGQKEARANAEKSPKRPKRVSRGRR
jgi:hypothetical protein